MKTNKTTRVAKPNAGAVGCWLQRLVRFYFRSAISLWTDMAVKKNHVLDANHVKDMNTSAPESIISKTSNREMGSGDAVCDTKTQQEIGRTSNTGQKSRFFTNVRRLQMVIAVALCGIGLCELVESDPRGAALSFACAIICIMSARNNMTVCSQSVVTVANIGIEPNVRVEPQPGDKRLKYENETKQ